MFFFCGFCILWRILAAEDCSLNKTLDAPQSPTENNFSSPYYPHGFPMNLTCGWYIMAPENHFVWLELTSQLALELPSNDSVDVYDGDGSELAPFAFLPWLSDNPQRAKVKHAEFYSKSRFVYIVFKTDDKVNGSLDQGIFVKYSAVRTARSCSPKNSYKENLNILLQDHSGTIITPGYPHGYSDSLINECYWKIMAPKGKVVRVEFPSFHLALFDYVLITDRISGKIPWYIYHYGKQASFTFYSTGNELTIRVISRTGTSGPGFIANYSSVPTVLSGHCNLKENSTVHMSGKGRGFSTPGFPIISGGGTCSWNITVPLGEFVKLTFWRNYARCHRDYVDVYDVSNSTRITLGKFCDKSTEEVVYSRGNNLLVKYFSLRVDISGGFIASFESVKAVPARYSCYKTKYDFVRNNLNATHGEFASYDYPLQYPNNVKCLWAIESPAEFFVQITFHSFDLQQSQDCQADYVEIKQGEYDYRSEVIGRFCGSSLPPVVLSNQSNVFVDFVTDMSGKHPGFHASYKILPNPSSVPG